jgi:hypothetical protein
MCTDSVRNSVLPNYGNDFHGLKVGVAGAKLNLKKCGVLLVRYQLPWISIKR